MSLLTSFWDHPAVIGILIGLPSAAIGFLAYRRSVRGEEAAKLAGDAILEDTKLGRVVDGLNTIVTIVQADNKVLREELVRVRETVQELEHRFEQETRDLHAENEALRSENVTLKARVAELEKNSPPA